MTRKSNLEETASSRPESSTTVNPGDFGFVESFLPITDPQEIMGFLYRNKVRPYNLKLNRIKYSESTISPELVRHLVRGRAIVEQIEACIKLKRKYFNGSIVRVEIDKGVITLYSGRQPYKT